MLVDVLPKDTNGQIILNPAGKIRSELVSGTVDPTWFKASYPVASSNVPLSTTDFATLKGIDQFWSANADVWRSQGLV